MKYITMKNLTVDTILLNKQRRALLRLRNETKKLTAVAALDGIINMLDDIADGLEDNGGVNLSVQKLG